MILFYRDLSNIIGGKVDPNFHNLFNHHLSSVLVKREMTKTAFDKIEPFINGGIFLDEENNRAHIRRFSQLIDVLNREASAIEALAKTYRASI